MKTGFHFFSQPVKTGIAKSPFPTERQSPTICTDCAGVPCRRGLECGGWSPLLRRRLVAVKGRCVSEPARTSALARAVNAPFRTHASRNSTATSRLVKAVTSHRTPKPGGAPAHYPRRSADFQVCCVAGFQTRGRSGHPQRLAKPHAPRTYRPLPIWKSAIQQVGKPALSVFAEVRAVRTGASGSLSSVRNGGEGWGEEALRNGDMVRMGGAPLSPTLSPFVPHGERETDALLVVAVSAQTFATADTGAVRGCVPKIAPAFDCASTSQPHPCPSVSIRG